MGVCIIEDDIRYWELALGVAEVMNPFIKECIERFGVLYFLPLPRPLIEYLPKILDPNVLYIFDIPLDYLCYLIPRMFHSFESYRELEGRSFIPYPVYEEMERHREPDFYNAFIYTLRCAGFSYELISKVTKKNIKTIDSNFRKFFFNVHGRKYDPSEDRIRLPDPPGWKNFLREKCINCAERGLCETSASLPPPPLPPHRYKQGFPRLATYHTRKGYLQYLKSYWNGEYEGHRGYIDGKTELCPVIEEYIGKKHEFIPQRDLLVSHGENLDNPERGNAWLNIAYVSVDWPEGGKAKIKVKEKIEKPKPKCGFCGYEYLQPKGKNKYGDECSECIMCNTVQQNTLPSKNYIRLSRKKGIIGGPKILMDDDQSLSGSMRNIIKRHGRPAHILPGLGREVSKARWAKWKQNNIKHGNFVEDQGTPWEISYRMLDPEDDEE